MKSIYPLFCPVAAASEILEPRWTMLVLCELWSGSVRFSQIQRGVPGMSPALLSRRLKEMERKGLIARTVSSGRGHSEYRTTPMADELEPIIRRLGEWAHRNVDSDVTLSHLDARLLMWNIRRKIDTLALPNHKCVIQFTLHGADREAANYWLVTEPGVEPDLCYSNPGLSVDLFIVADLQAITSAWMGRSTFQGEIASGRISLIGHAVIARNLTRWLVKSSYAGACEEGVPSGFTGRVAAE